MLNVGGKKERKIHNEYQKNCKFIFFHIQMIFNLLETWQILDQFWLMK